MLKYFYTGIGKTTIIKELCKKLRKNRVHVEGFYTTELRGDSGSRTGFDVVTLNGKQSKLARVR